MSSDRTHVARAVRVRMFIVSGLLALGFGFVVSSGYTLQVIDGQEWRELAEKQRQRRLHVTPKRGSIYDRNGSALAVSVEVPSVTMDAVELLRGVHAERIAEVARAAAERLATALGVDRVWVEQRILDQRRFTWLKRRITVDEAEKIRQLTSSSAGEFRLRGIKVDGEGQRYYPRRELGGALLGFVAPDGEGKDGLELLLNDELKGQVELVPGLRDRSGKLLFAEAVENDQALAGHEVYLSIDQGIQYVAERELAAAARTFEALGGSVIVVRPATGEILAQASFPGYNPNDYRTSEPGARRDRSVTDRFEPGSTMKIFTVAAALAGNAIHPNQLLDCENGRLTIDKVVIRDTHPAQWLSIAQVLAFSSNVCAAKIGLALGGRKLYEGLRRFGFGEKTGVPLPGEAQGVLLPRGRPWVQVETAAVSFGQGLSATNLQLAMATAAIANDGKLMEPILVKRVTTAEGELIREAVPVIRQQAVPASVARTVADLMVGVTEGEGTGVEAAVLGFRVAGKTATAQKTDPATGRYSHDRYVASFVGFVPAKNPEVCISVVLDEPIVEHAGGVVAAPVFRRVAEASLTYLGVVPKERRSAVLAAASSARMRPNTNQVATQQALARRREPLPAHHVRVPDMTGWPIRRAINKSIELGVMPVVSGGGLLVSQEPEPGGVLARGDSLSMVFEPEL